MMAAVPGLGAVIEIGKMLNDGSKAASAVVEAGSEAVETASDAFVETTENVKQGLQELDEKKKMAEQISNRTTKSINDFENPLPATAQAAGGRKTKRRLFKRKAKSKRVRFAT
jgi:ABC-type transporter Mla subunit MlaD